MIHGPWMNMILYELNGSFASFFKNLNQFWCQIEWILLEMFFESSQKWRNFIHQSNVRSNEDSMIVQTTFRSCGIVYDESLHWNWNLSRHCIHCQIEVWLVDLEFFKFGFYFIEDGWSCYWRKWLKILQSGDYLCDNQNWLLCWFCTFFNLGFETKENIFRNF